MLLPTENSNILNFEINGQSLNLLESTCTSSSLYRRNFNLSAKIIIFLMYLYSPEDSFEEFYFLEKSCIVLKKLAKFQMHICFTHPMQKTVGNRFRVSKSKINFKK